MSIPPRFSKPCAVQDAQLEFSVHSNKRCLHVFLRHEKRDVALRRALRDCHDVYVLSSHSSESTLDNSWCTAHPLAHNCYDRSPLIEEGDVFHITVHQILRKLPAECFNCSLGDCGWSNKTSHLLDITLAYVASFGYVDAPIGFPETHSGRNSPEMLAARSSLPDLALPARKGCVEGRPRGHCSREPGNLHALQESRQILPRLGLEGEIDFRLFAGIQRNGRTDHVAMRRFNDAADAPPCTSQASCAQGVNL